MARFDKSFCLHGYNYVLVYIQYQPHTYFLVTSISETFVLVVCRSITSYRYLYGVEG
jgi:hypothetical protein